MLSALNMFSKVKDFFCEKVNALKWLWGKLCTDFFSNMELNNHTISGGFFRCRHLFPGHS